MLECGECEGRSAARLHSRSVHCDKLNFRSSTPTLARLQSCNTSVWNRSPWCGRLFRTWSWMRFWGQVQCLPALRPNASRVDRGFRPGFGAVGLKFPKIKEFICVRFYLISYSTVWLNIVRGRWTELLGRWRIRRGGGFWRSWRRARSA